jgi:hypothetical protein
MKPRIFAAVRELRGLSQWDVAERAGRTPIHWPTEFNGMAIRGIHTVDSLSISCALLLILSHGTMCNREFWRWRRLGSGALFTQHGS